MIHTAPNSHLLEGLGVIVARIEPCRLQIILEKRITHPGAGVTCIWGVDLPDSVAVSEGIRKGFLRGGRGSQGCCCAGGCGWFGGNWPRGRRASSQCQGQQKKNEGFIFHGSNTLSAASQVNPGSYGIGSFHLPLGRWIGSKSSSTVLIRDQKSGWKKELLVVCAK